MEYRKLGRSGIKISALSLGSWLTFGKQIGDSVAEELMTIAYDAGVNFFDNAEVYAAGQAEVVMGNILKKKAWSRESYLLSSKVFFGLEGTKKSKPNMYGLSRKHIMEGCHASLKRLQADYLDLYLCHRPDKDTPIAETVWTMTNLIRQGKILYWGTSEWSAAEIVEAFLVAEKNHLIGPVLEQPQYNMIVREKMEKEYLHLFKYHGLGTTIWSPLASGTLTGKYLESNPTDTRINMDDLTWLKERVLNSEKQIKVRKLLEIARRLETSLPKLAIGWCLKNPNVSTVLLGASKGIQLKETLDSLAVVPLLTPDIMQEIDLIWENKPVLPEF